MAKVIDCTIFYNEFMMLDFRLASLRDVVSRFVIVEADTSFSGKPKGLELRQWLHDTHPDLVHRIDLVEVTDMPANPNPWVKEAHQRDAILRGLGTAHRNDLVMMFDIDEIPDVARIEASISNSDICAVEQSFYYYFFNLFKGVWRKGTASLFRNLAVSPNTARGLFGRPLIENAGWHFSYLMPPAAIAEKISAFSHQEFNKPQFTDPVQIANRIAARADLFGRKAEAGLRPCVIDDSFPVYLRENSRKYAAFIIDTVGEDGSSPTTVGERAP
jgi:beta-1,4-mannosyl-glycoprotein beta-1,4-N-acetylglucosaminyltransferase